MINKDNVNMYLDAKISWYEKQLQHSKSLDDANIGKHTFIATESRVISELKEIQAYINSGLVNIVNK